MRTAVLVVVGCLVGFLVGRVTVHPEKPEGPGWWCRSGVYSCFPASPVAAPPAGWEFATKVVCSEASGRCFGNRTACEQHEQWVEVCADRN